MQGPPSILKKKERKSNRSRHPLSLNHVLLTKSSGKLIIQPPPTLPDKNEVMFGKVNSRQKVPTLPLSHITLPHTKQIQTLLHQKRISPLPLK